MPKRYLKKYIHSYTNSDQKLAEILLILNQTGFRYYVDPPVKNINPFSLVKYSEFDMQINIFALKKT